MYKGLASSWQAAGKPWASRGKQGLRPTFACTRAWQAAGKPWARAWQAAGKPRASRGKQGCFSGKLGFWTFQTYMFLYKPALRNLAQVPLTEPRDLLLHVQGLGKQLASSWQALGKPRQAGPETAYHF